MTRLLYSNELICQSEENHLSRSINWKKLTTSKTTSESFGSNIINVVFSCHAELAGPFEGRKTLQASEVFDRLHIGFDSFLSFESPRSILRHEDLLVESFYRLFKVRDECRGFLPNFVLEVEDLLREFSPVFIH
jgi:hypothetical protein